MLPDTSLFIHAYLRTEAPMSSQIECTQSSFADLLLYESDKDRRQLEALGRSADPPSAPTSTSRESPSRACATWPRISF